MMDCVKRDSTEIEMRFGHAASCFGPGLAESCKKIQYEISHKRICGQLKLFRGTRKTPAVTNAECRRGFGGFWLFLGVWIVACVLLGIIAYRRLGYVLQKTTNAREKTLRMIRQIAKRKGWHFDTGIFVIHL
jgi:hypothetical protein